MSRTTLKLPAKPSVPDGADDIRRSARKPVRGGAKLPKQSVAQRAGNSTATPVRLAADVVTTRRADHKPRTSSGSGEDRPVPPLAPSGPQTAEVPVRAKAVLPEPALRATPLPKTYPKRGIARSTGARALPPARSPSESSAPRPHPERRDAAPQAAPVLTPPISPVADHAAPPVRQAGEPKSQRRALPEPPRLSRRISEMSQCSRRQADEWIENGWVSVDGVVVTTLGTRVHPGARVEIGDAAGRHQTESVTILLNKPPDLACGQTDDGGECARQLICPENRWLEDDTRCTFKTTHLRGLALAGKLDDEATGMLVFTQEGSVARRIVGNDIRLEKEYMVRVEGELSPQGMQLLKQSLALDAIKLKRAQVSWQNERQLRFVLHESRPIQRMCERVGLRVTSIKCIRIGSVSLGKLPAGQWRYLRENERF